MQKTRSSKITKKYSLHFSDEQTPCTKFEEYPDESDEESDQSDDESDFSYMAAPSESEDSYDKLVENFSQDYQKLGMLLKKVPTEIFGKLRI